MKKDADSQGKVAFSRLATRTRFVARSILCSLLLLAAPGCGESSNKEGANSEKKAEKSPEPIPANPSEPTEKKVLSKEDAGVAVAAPGVDAAVAEAKAVAPPDASVAAKEPKDPPELIELWFKSAPSGAVVHRVTNGKATFMGFTPFRLELEKRDATEDFEFRLRGYEVGARSYRMNKAGTVHVALEALGRSAPASAGGTDAGHGEPPR